MQRRHRLVGAGRRPQQDAADRGVLQRRDQRRDPVRIRDHGLGAGGLDLGGARGVARGRPHGMAAGDQLPGQLEPAATAADDQTPGQALRAASMPSGPRRASGAELLARLLPGALGQTPLAPMGVGDLEQLVELAVGQILLTPPILLVQVVVDAQLVIRRR